VSKVHCCKLKHCLKGYGGLCFQHTTSLYTQIKASNEQPVDA